MISSDDENKELEYYFKKIGNSEIPPVVEARLRKRLLFFRKKMEQNDYEYKRTEKFIMYLKNASKSPQLRWSVGTIFVVIAIMLILIANPWFHKTDTAFAFALEKIRKAHSASWIWTFYQNGIPNQNMQVLFLEPSHIRLSSASEGGVISVCDLELGKCLTLIPEEKTFLEIDMINFPINMHGVNFIDRLRTVPEREAKFLGEREILGRKAKGFKVSKQEADTDVWVDSNNGDLIKVEIKSKIEPNIDLVMSNIKLNIPVDESLFNISPPEGYNRRKHQIDLTMSSESGIRTDEIPLGQLQIKRSTSLNNSITANQGEYSAKGMSLYNIINSAYGGNRSRMIFELPISNEWYDVYLKMPQGQEDLLWETLQKEQKKVLEKQFGITAYHEIQDKDVYILTAPNGRTSRLHDPISNRGSSVGGGKNRIFKNVEIDIFAGELENILQHPVINETNLDGRYDFEFKLSGKEPKVLADEISKQLGLQLTPGIRPVKILIVERK